MRGSSRRFTQRTTSQMLKAPAATEKAINTIVRNCEKKDAIQCGFLCESARSAHPSTIGLAKINKITVPRISILSDSPGEIPAGSSTGCRRRLLRKPIRKSSTYIPRISPAAGLDVRSSRTRKITNHGNSIQPRGLPRMRRSGFAKPDPMRPEWQPAADRPTHRLPIDGRQAY